MRLLLACVLLFGCTAPTAEPTPSPTPPPSPTEPLPANRARLVGVVMDEDDGKPLADVCVSGGKPGGCTWKSDAYGRFQVGDLPSGVWEFFFEKTGYQTTRREVLLQTAVVLSQNVRMSR